MSGERGKWYATNRTKNEALNDYFFSFVLSLFLLRTFSDKGIVKCEIIGVCN